MVLKETEEVVFIKALKALAGGYTIEIKKTSLHFICRTTHNSILEKMLCAFHKSR